MIKKFTLLCCSTLLLHFVSFSQWIDKDSTLTNEGSYSALTWPSSVTITIPDGVTVNATSLDGGGNLIVNGTLNVTGKISVSSAQKFFTVGSGGIVSSQGLYVGGTLNLEGSLDYGAADGQIQTQLNVGEHASIKTTAKLTTTGGVELKDHSSMECGTYNGSLQGEKIILDNGVLFTVHGAVDVSSGTMEINEGATFKTDGDFSFSNPNNVINGTLWIGGTLTLPNSPNTMACPGQIITEHLNNQNVNTISGSGYIEVHQSFTGSNPLTSDATIILNAPAASTGNPGSATLGTASDCAGAPLPVGIQDFKGVFAEGKTSLTWITTSELNNNRFVIERSKDGINYVEIGTKISQVASGTGTNELHYSFVDQQPLAGKSYYRLKQIDNNGEIHYYEKTVGITTGATISIRLYPNPVHSILNISKAAATGETFVIIDVAGRKVLSATQSTINVGKLPRGIYFVQLVNASGSQVVGKFIKK